MTFDRYFWTGLATVAGIMLLCWFSITGLATIATAMLTKGQVEVMIAAFLVIGFPALALVGARQTGNWSGTYTGSFGLLRLVLCHN